MKSNLRPEFFGGKVSAAGGLAPRRGWVISATLLAIVMVALATGYSVMSTSSSRVSQPGATTPASDRLPSPEELAIHIYRAGRL